MHETSNKPERSMEKHMNVKELLCGSLFVDCSLAVRFSSLMQTETNKSFKWFI